MDGQIDSTDSNDRHASAQAGRRPVDRGIVAVAMVAAAALGLPEGSIGVLWPSVSADLGIPLDRLGVILYAATFGYLAVAFGHGRIARRYGTVVVVAGAAAIGSAGAIVFASAAAFGAVVAGYLLVGAAAGGIDTGLNGYVSVHHRRVLPFMHAGFGVGASLAPLVVTRLRDAGISWRYALGGLAVYEATLVVLFVASRHRFIRPESQGPGHRHLALDLSDIDIPLTDESLVPPASDTRGVEPSGVEGGPEELPSRPHGSSGRGRALLALSIASFFLYVGVEAGIGAWGFTLLTGRGVDATVAGVAIGGFFVAITFGRLAIGFVGDRVTPRRVLAVAISTAVAGTLALWQVGAAVPQFQPYLLVLVGLSLAGIFPMLVALTPERLGASGTQAVIGWQLAGASIGLSTVPAMIGVMAGRAGTDAIAPCLFAVAVALAVVHLCALAIERG